MRCGGRRWVLHGVRGVQSVAAVAGAGSNRAIRWLEAFRNGCCGFVSPKRVF